MKTYTGTELCKICGKEFKWEYTDSGYRRGMGEYLSPVMPVSSDPSIAPQ